MNIFCSWSINQNGIIEQITTINRSGNRIWPAYYSSVWTQQQINLFISRDFIPRFFMSTFINSAFFNCILSNKIQATKANETLLQLFSQFAKISVYEITQKLELGTRKSRLSSPLFNYIRIRTNPDLLPFNFYFHKRHFIE